MKIPITINQASALRDDINEINQLNQLVQIKAAANKRHCDTIMRDLEQDPDAFTSYNLVTENGQWFLALTENPRTQVEKALEPKE